MYPFFRMPVANEDLAWDLLKNAVILVVTGILGKIWGNLKQCCSHAFFIDQCLSRSTPPQHRIFGSNLGERSNFLGQKQPSCCWDTHEYTVLNNKQTMWGEADIFVDRPMFLSFDKEPLQATKVEVELVWGRNEPCFVTKGPSDQSNCPQPSHVPVLDETCWGSTWPSLVVTCAFPNSSGFGVFSHNQKVLGQDCFLPGHVSLGQMHVGLKTVLWKVAPRFPNVFPQSFYPTVSLNVPLCVCKYIHTHTCTYIHTYIHTYLRKYVYTYGNMKS